MKRKKSKPFDVKNDKKDESLSTLKEKHPEEYHKEMIAECANRYDECKTTIDRMVEEIKGEINTCNPLSLLNFLKSISDLSFMNMPSEYHMGTESVLNSRSLEYVQSVLVSSPCDNEYSESDSNIEFAKYEIILQKCVELQSKTYEFYFCWSGHVLSQDNTIDNQLLQYIIESQLMQTVRGDRYQIYQVEHLKSLVQPHDAILCELFDVSADKFIEGLKKLEYSLSSEKIDVGKFLFNEWENIANPFDNQSTDLDLDTFFEETHNNMIPYFEKLLGNSLYDVKKVTGWSHKLIDNLSFGLGQYDKFYYDGDYSGWPIIDLPVQKKPFIKIGTTSYCFDYFSLFDNIYRVLQKTIKGIKPSYMDTWAQIQQHTSESLVEDLMKKLLPGCQTFRDNYYPKNNSLKQCDENDILVIYDTTLFIIEVKAGSFVYTPAIYDYKAHIKSFQTLIEKADYQCERTLNYIKKNSVASIYDSEKNKKVEIYNSKINEIYTMCVTVDNFNEFAAKAEKLSFINLQKGTIALSIDDLRVYSDIFDNPLSFLHFFSERKKATQISQLELSDELDHLGLYLNRNLYTMNAEELKENEKLMAVGFRENLDSYFASRHNTNLTFKKPEQLLPSKVKEIIELLVKQNKYGVSYLSSFLLNFDFETRKNISENIEYALIRQKQINHMTQLVTYGDIRYCLFIFQPEIEIMSEKNRLDYIFATMLMHNEIDRLCVNSYYNENNVLEDIDWNTYLLSDIPKDEYSELKLLGDSLFQSRIQSYKKRENIKKIGRNDTCPCGSGKKYKHCCINRVFND